jgi:uncharacterized protein YjbJ (UPF0337 family)
LAVPQQPVCCRTYRKDIRMNWDRIEGNWKQLADKVKRQWGKLIDGQLDHWTGKKPVAHGQARRQETALWLNPLWWAEGVKARGRQPKDPDRDAEHRWENEGGNPPLTEAPDANPRKHL